MFDSTRIPAIEPGHVKALVTRAASERAALIAAVADKPLVAEALKAYFETGAAVAAQLERVDLRPSVVDPAVDGSLRGLRAVCHARVDGYQLGDHLTLDAEQQRDLLRARAVEAALIGPDLRFAQLGFLDEWREVAMRFGRLDEPLAELGETTREAATALGAGPLVRHAERLFNAYGEALGILGPGGQLDPAYEAFLAAVRRLSLALELVYGDAAPAIVRAHIITPLDDTYARQRAARQKAIARRRNGLSDDSDSASVDAGPPADTEA